MELTGARDVAGDVQRAEQATIDRPDHVPAVRRIGVQLDRARNRGAVERARDDVSGRICGRRNQRVAAQVHTATQQKDGAVLEGKRGRADTERTASGERIGTEDHTASGERGRPLVGVVAREEEVARTRLD